MTISGRLSTKERTATVRRYIPHLALEQAYFPRVLVTIAINEMRDQLRQFGCKQPSKLLTRAYADRSCTVLEIQAKLD